MVLTNGHNEALLLEYEQEGLHKKLLFDIQDFEDISEIRPSVLLRELSVEHDPEAFAETLLENLLFGRLQLTRETINQINLELRTRKNMLFFSQEEIEKEAKDLFAYLHRLELFDMDNKGASLLRANVRTQLTQINKERRSNMVVAWQDMVHLRARQREHLQEYNSLLRTRTLLEM